MYSCKSKDKVLALIRIKTQTIKFGHCSHEKFVLCFDTCRLINVKKVLPLLAYIPKDYLSLKQQKKQYFTCKVLI